ncbi:mediator of RNA polymerase II transcription subunit 12 isoform X2 [Daktulosphaira vitifoliae]|uniref:mediator of RNA polymerase II transcription subunit 12 isoform X2 n=1 Tax=Daktulosphaira vitifoliae TaxID=58002 RepID=UPI0021A9A508|nr:mediator of RNA polymerase II transcription subunit 12 isoform X2 [Daktulosphaira vitifoliae]
MMGFSYEKRPLKRPRLGPPDVYPQEPKQKEDELTTVNVKHGFTTSLTISDEHQHGTARNYNITASKIGAFFNAIINKKEELNTLLDTGRKRLQINPKDNFWPATARSKTTVEAWFKDLAGIKPLNILSKKAPNFNKKEEIFMLLCEYNVPLIRATWFIKLSSAYTIAVSEAKIKSKRQLPDPTLEWTSTLLKFTKEQLIKLQDYYQSTSSSNNSSLHFMTEEQKISLKQWNYCSSLIKYMYQEGLLERQEVLQWILDLLERYKSSSVSEDGLLKVLCPLALQYCSEFCQSELLSRKLVYFCSRKLNSMCNSVVDSNPPSSPNSKGTSSISAPSNNSTITNAAAILNDMMACPHHRDILLPISCIIQIILLECPTSLVWNHLGGGKLPSILNGSPLDYLPCSPIILPMPQRTNNVSLRKQLKQFEEIVRLRSQAAEGRWCLDKFQKSSIGAKTMKILTVLDALDRHSFERIDQNNSLDTLYNKIFSSPNVKDNLNTLPIAVGGITKSSDIDLSKDNRTEYSIDQDQIIVKVLCEWALSSLRHGEHRGMAVARLLDKRQAEITGRESDSSVENIPSGPNEDKDSVVSTPATLPLFQSLLMHFLDHDAPILENNHTSRITFTNLVNLFTELIRNDVFSHDAYMCTLISRGDLQSNNGGSQHSSNSKPTDTPSGAGSTQGPAHIEDDNLFDLKPNVPEHHNRHMDYDDSKIDDDLDKLLQHIKEEQQNSMDAPDSPKVEPFAGSSIGGLDSNNPSTSTNENMLKGRPSRHLLYATHFPLPLDEETTSHDCNQRHVLLYGFGKMRDDARHTIKRISKDICKLFSKKFSIDIAEGGKVKKHSRNEFNFEATTARVQNLSYFDQHVVTWQCSLTVLESINAFATGNSNYLPVQEHVAFLFDLMELALNVNTLLDVCIQILMDIPDVEAQLTTKGSSLVRLYTTSLVLYIVGVLRRYHCCLLLNQEQVIGAFENLYRVVKHVSNPAECLSVERCVLSHLYDLYLSAAPLLKGRLPGTEPFNTLYIKIRQTLHSNLQPSTMTQGNWNSSYMSELILSYRRGYKIDSGWYRQLNESQSNRYSLVCNVIIAVASETDIERLNDLAILSAELTASCSSLASEWLGVLMALCCSSNNPIIFGDVFSHVKMNDIAVHNSLALFTSILVARHCFSLEDFVVHVALPSLLTVSNEGHGAADTDPEAEASARLTCHLLLRLFKTTEVPQPSLYSVGASPNPIPNTSSGCSIKQSCDRHLLAAAHNNIRVGPLLAVLKAIIVVGDATAQRPNQSIKKSPSSQVSTPGGTSKMAGELSISHILGTTDILGGSADHLLMELRGLGNSDTQTPGLSELAQFVLREICSQEWVLERCLQNPEELCHQDMLLDSMLSSKQAQRLLHMICYPETASGFDISLDSKTIITNILENSDQWTLRMSWLEMQLMFKQFTTNSPDLNQWLDTVAKAAIDMFQQNPNTQNKSECLKKTHSMWLLAPLISKLPSAVQGRVLKVAGQVLESGNMIGLGNTNSGNVTPIATHGVSGGGSSSRSSNKGTPPHPRPAQNLTTVTPTAAILAYHQPFLSLVLSCLKGQDDQKENLLSSLHNQLSQYLILSKEERLGIQEGCANNKEVNAIQNSLSLRFSLVGGMFDTIQRNTTLTTDWAVLLVQLVTYSVIDLTNNTKLFSTIIDMLATLIHSTLVSDSQTEKGEENRKHYQNLMKKLKKEVGEKYSPSISQVRQLLPLGKQQCEIISCEQIGTDGKGNKISSGMDANDKQGLKVCDKQRVSSWDLLEGHKNPAPLSWSWFSAVRVERKPLWYEENHRMLKFHTHSLVKTSSYFLEPLPLPPEDLEPPQEKPCPCVYCNQIKNVGPGINIGPGTGRPDTPSSVPESPGRGIKRGMKAQGGPSNQRRKKQQQPPPMSPLTPNTQMGPSQIHPQMQGQQNQHMAYGGPNGGIYPMQQNTGPNPAQIPQQNPQWGNYGQQSQGGPSFYSQQVPPTQGPGPGSRFDRPVNTSKQALSHMLRMRLPTNQYMGQTPQQPNMNPNFQPMPRQQFIRGQHNVPIQPPPQQQNSNQMYSQQQQPTQMYSNMQQSMNQNYGGYVGQQAGMRPPYMQNQNVPMNPMGGPQNPTPPYNRPTVPNQQVQNSQYQQQLSQQRIRHIMAMQQQQQQQQQQHLMQRQMQNPQQQQSHPYGLQPPPY